MALVLMALVLTDLTHWRCGHPKDIKLKPRAFGAFTFGLLNKGWADAASLVFIESHFKLSISALLRAMFDDGYFPPNTPPD